MANIIINRKSRSWQKNKDKLHNRRKFLAEQIKEGIMSKSEMNSGEEGEPAFDEKVSYYDKWKKDNEPKMREWSDLNKEFKAHGEEGKPMSVDSVRESKTKGKDIKYQ